MAADIITQVGAVLRVPTHHVQPGPNARGSLGDLTELAVSIKAIGLQEPLLVHDLGDGQYRCFDGHRRLAASKLAGCPTVDVIVRPDPGEPQSLQRQLAIHAQGRGFDPIAEAHALHALVFVHKRRHEDIARAVGKTPRWVSDRLALLVLTADQQQQIRDGRASISMGLAWAAEHRAVRDGRPARTTSVDTRTATPRSGTPAHCATCRCGRR